MTVGEWRTPAEAVGQFVDSIRPVLACVTRGFADVGGGYWPKPEPHSLLLNAGQPVRLRSALGLHLLVRMRYRIVEVPPGSRRWAVETVAYEYRLSDLGDREIVAYHWHPEGSSHVRTPHLHLGPGGEIGLRTLTAAHLPTGAINLADVVALAIEAFGATPLRADWPRVLDRAHRQAGTR